MQSCSHAAETFASNLVLTAAILAWCRRSRAWILPGPCFEYLSDFESKGVISKGGSSIIPLLDCRTAFPGSNRFAKSPGAREKTHCLFHSPSRGKLRIVAGLLRAAALQCLLIMNLSKQEPSAPSRLYTGCSRISIHGGYIGNVFKVGQRNGRRNGGNRSTNYLRVATDSARRCRSRNFMGAASGTTIS
jgi:hypothetical protein